MLSSSRVHEVLISRSHKLMSQTVAVPFENITDNHIYVSPRHVGFTRRQRQLQNQQHPAIQHNLYLDNTLGSYFLQVWYHRKYGGNYATMTQSCISIITCINKNLTLLDIRVDKDRPISRYSTVASAGPIHTNRNLTGRGTSATWSNITPWDRRRNTTHGFFRSFSVPVNKVYAYI